MFLPGFPLILRATERYVPDLLLSQRLEIVGPVRMEHLQDLLGGLRHMEIAGHCDFQVGGIMVSALAGPPLEVDQGDKAFVS